jgi:hypothetical protein
MPTYTAPDGTPYTSSAVPINTRTITIYRGDGSTAGGGASPTSLGTYLVENFTIGAPGKVVRRMGTSGEDTDMAVVRSARTVSGKLQVKSALGQATPIPGDYFNESVDVVITTLAAAGTNRFIISDISKDETAGSPWTYSITCTEDIENSARYTV